MTWGDERIGAFMGLYYFASSIAAVAGPQVVGVLIHLTVRTAGLYSSLRVLYAAGGLVDEPGEGGGPVVTECRQQGRSEHPQIRRLRLQSWVQGVPQAVAQEIG